MTVPDITEIHRQLGRITATLENFNEMSKAAQKDRADLRQRLGNLHTQLTELDTNLKLIRQRDKMLYILGTGVVGLILTIGMPKIMALLT